MERARCVLLICLAIGMGFGRLCPAEEIRKLVPDRLLNDLEDERKLEDDGDSDVITITANRVPVPAADSGSAVTVIGREEIEARRQTSVYEVLRTVPGVEVAQTGSFGGVTSLFLRGANSNHTLVLVDGVRVNSTTTGAFDFADLSADNIERIEVLRGPQSTLYGSEAMGGVINIVTQRGADEPEYTLDIEGGSFGTMKGRVSVAGSESIVEYSANAAFETTEGVSMASERAGNTEEDGYKKQSFSGRIAVTPVGWLRAAATVRATRSETDLDGFAFVFPFGPVDDPNARQERDVVGATVTLEAQPHEIVRQKVRVGVSHDDLEGIDPDTFFNNYRIRSTILDAEWQSDVQVHQTLLLTAGYTYENRAGEIVGSYDETVEINSVYGQAMWTPVERVSLVGGVRHDDHSQFGGETTFRATASLLVPESNTRLHGSIGTGFSAPSFNDLYFPGSSNPDLEPETSLGYDIGVTQSFFDERLVIDVTSFTTKFRDLISAAPPTFVPVNIEKATASGLEATVTARPVPGFTLTAAYTLTDAEDESTGNPLPRRPKHKGSLTATLKSARGWSGSLAAIGVRERVDSGGAPMDDYVRVDLSVAYEINRHVQLHARVNNLLDRDYEEINGFTTPGIAVIAGLRLRW